MPKRIFEFVCEEGHITESFVDSECRESQCKECGKPASRIMSSPQVKLEGVTGDFPGAYDKWERVRAEKLAVEKKRNS